MDWQKVCEPPDLQNRPFKIGMNERGRPEICVEVLSLRNSDEEMDEKRELFLKSGAKEVWFCDEKGRIRFFDSKTETRKSVLMPDFPESI